MAFDVEQTRFLAAEALKVESMHTRIVAMRMRSACDEIDSLRAKLATANDKRENLAANCETYRETAEAAEAELKAARAVVEAARRCMIWQTGSARVRFENRAADAAAWDAAIAAYDAATKAGEGE